MALHTRVLRLVLSGLMGALLVVSKQAMSGLPNLEPVSLLIILFALELPRETKFSQLTDMLYERDFVQPQKPGYRYLYQDHLCGMAHELGDYIPETASKLELKVFDLPVIMV